MNKKNNKTNVSNIGGENNSRKTLSEVLSAVGLLAIMIAALLPLLHQSGDWMRYLYAVGAAILLGGRIATPKVGDGASLRLRRLVRMEFWAAVLFVVGAVFLFIPKAGATDWLAFTLAGGVLTVYTSIMIPRQKLDK